MLAPFILAGTFFVLAAILTYFALKHVFRAVSTVLTIVALACAIVLFGITYDTQHFQEQLAMSDKLFVYDQDGFKAAFVHRNDPSPLLLADTSAERAAFAANDFKTLRGSRELVFVIRRDAFASMTGVAINGNIFDAQTLLNLLASDNPRDAYIAEIRKVKQIPAGQEVQMAEISAEELKGVILAAIVNEYLHSQSLVRGVHDGHVDVYPSSITSWVMENAPYPILKFILKVDNA